jgi:FAD:protein FMN transferase
MIPPPRLCLAALLLAAAPAPVEGSFGPRATEAKTFKFDHENILGTSLHLELHAEEAVAKKAKVDLFAEIERLRGVLSIYDPKSELMRLPRPCPATPASADLRAVMHACDRWRSESKEAFHPGVELLTQRWAAAEKNGSPPASAELEAARAKLARPLWTIDDEHGTVALLTEVPICFDALAKGYIIDRAVVVAEAAGASDIVLEIGGDLRVSGASSSRIAVADPREPAENAAHLCDVDLSNVAAATSGGYARGFNIAGKHYSHIFDPRTGLPVDQVLQATVIAPDATTADALATILNVLSPEEGLALIAKTAGTASMVVDAQGVQHPSPNWSKFVRNQAPPAPPVQPSALPGGGEIVLAFELQQPPAGGRGGSGGERERRGGSYRRPYVAAWIEDEHSKPVRTLCLWIQKPRWIDDLRRWSGLYPGKQDDVRAVTRATRAAGAYELVWNGRDDAGQPVAPGKYTIFLEVVREHGTYQILSHAIDVTGAAFSADMVGEGVEVKAATVSMRPPAAKK